jgi:hypothetical protein
MEKGLTLRKKGNRRSQQEPKPSAPKEISGPVHLRKPAASGSNTLAVPREKNKGGDDTSDFVKRRYSTRFNAPPDFLSGAPPIPGIPSLPARYADQLQRPGSRERPGTGGSQPIRIDLLALRDPALQADKCEVLLRIMWALLIHCQTSRNSCPMQQNKKYATIRTAYGRSRIGLLQTSSKMSIKIEPSSSRSARRLRSSREKCEPYGASCRISQEPWVKQMSPMALLDHRALMKIVQTEETQTEAPWQT